MLEFIQEALGGFAECHEAFTQTTNSGTYLKVLVDLADGEDLKWFCISAVEVSGP